MSTIYYAKTTSISAETIQNEFSKFSGFSLIQKSQSDFVIFGNDSQITLHLDHFGCVTGATRNGQTDVTIILEILDHECGLQFVSEYEIDDYLKAKNANNLLILYRSEFDKNLGELKAKEIGLQPVFFDQGSNQIDEDYLDCIRMGAGGVETWHCKHWWISAQVSENTNQEIHNFTEENPSVFVYRS